MATLPSSERVHAPAPQPASAAAPTPMRFFQAVHSFHQTAAMKAAVELDVFTAIAEGYVAPETIAQRCGCEERGARILCDYLTVMGWLRKSHDSYSLAPDAAQFLDRRSPAYVGTALNFLLSPKALEAFANLTASVRKGGTVLPEDVMEHENPIWVEFARSMAPLMTIPAQMLAEVLGSSAPQPWKVLDIAAGHGLYGLTVAKHNPQAHVVALDWPGVLAVAAENAQRLGVAERWRKLEGSAFEAEFGDGYDVVLLPNFCHHFGVAANERLLRKVHAALKPGGRIAILDFIPNEDRVTPEPAAAFALVMLALTPSGDAYTYREYQQMLDRSGFQDMSLHHLPVPNHRVVTAVR